MKKRWISINICFVLLATLMSGCGKKQNQSKEVTEMYSSYVAVAYSPDGTYTAAVSIQESDDDKFAEINKEDFKLSQTIRVDDTEEEIIIEDFEITKADEKTLKIDFKANSEYVEDSQLVLVSDKGVTESNVALQVIIFVVLPDPQIEFKYEGASRDSEKITGEITTTNNYKFVSDIKADDLYFESDINADIETTRVSDTEIDFTITNIQPNFYGNSIYLVVPAKVFDCTYNEDTILYMDYADSDKEIQYEEKEGINSDVDADINSNKVIVTLTPNNCSFADDVNSDDLIISGLDSLENVNVIVDKEKIEISADYTDEISENIYASVSIQADKIIGENKNEEYTSRFCIPAYEDERFSKTKLAVKITKAVVGAYGGKLASTVVGIALPELFDVLGIKDEDEGKQEIKERFADLSNEISDLSYQIKDVSNTIELGVNRNILNDFQLLGNELDVISLTILSEKEVNDYVDELKKNYDKKTGEYTDNQLVKNQKFIELVRKHDNNGNYISDVLEYGDQILATSSGTTSGVIDLYFKTIESKFNFESQVKNAQEAFINKLAVTYALNAAIAIQYCDAVGDANGRVLRAQAKEVSEKIDQFTKIMEEQNEMLDAGKDRLLVTNQIVDKKMIVFNTEDCIKDGGFEGFDYFENCSVAKIETNDMLKIMDRAKARNCSLSDDLVNAGFSNVPSKSLNSNNQYIYLCDKVKYDLVSKWDLEEFGRCVVALLTVDVKSKYCETYSDVVSQVGKNDGVKTCKKRICDKYEHYRAYKASYYSTDVFVKQLIGFRIAK